MASVRKSITQKGTTRWQSVWQEPAPAGKTQRRTKNHASQREAREHAQKMEAEVERRGVGDPQKHSVANYLARWIATLVDRGEHSPTTLSGYRRHIAMASKHVGHIALEKLSPADLDGLYTHLLRRGGADGGPLAPRTVIHVHRVLSTALEQARKWKFISENPAKDATAPSARKSPPKAFTEAEVALLLNAAARDREVYIVVSTLLITGIRRSELIGLALDAIDFETGTLTIKRVVLSVDNATIEREVTKSDASERSIQIPPALVDLLREQKARVLEAALKWGRGHRRDPMFLFARPDGEPLDPRTMSTRLGQVMRDAGIAGRPPTHGWRHTAATLLIGAGTDIKTVQTRLGHSTPAITLALYVHPIAAKDEAAGEHLAGLLKR